MGEMTVLFSFMSIQSTSGLVRRLSQSASCMQEVKQRRHGRAQTQAELVLNVKQLLFKEAEVSAWDAWT